MSENSEPTPTSASTAATNEEEDEVVSLMDVIASQDSIVAEADAVLGGCDDKNCTYSQVRPEMNTRNFGVTIRCFSVGLFEPTSAVFLLDVHPRCKG